MYLEKIKELVESGNAEITHVVSPPRAISTFFTVSLSEAIDGNHINEPFWHPNPDESMKQIYERLIELGADTPKTKKPVKLVVKDLARFMYFERLPKYLNLVSNLVFLVRDPHAQMPSVIKRRANYLDGNSKSENYTTDQAFEKIEEIDSSLARSDYVLTSWKPLQTIYNLACSQNKSTKISVVDTTVLREQPRQVLESLCDKLGFDYTDSMIRGPKKAAQNFCWPNSSWTRDRKTGAVIQNDPQVDMSAWVGKALKTEEYEKINSGSSYPIDRYKGGLKDHMNFATSVYSALTQGPHSLSPRDFAKIESLFNSVNNEPAITLQDRMPTAAYLYYASCSEDDSRKIPAVEKISEIRNKFPEFETSFDSIDTIVNRTKTPNLGRRL